jgi:acyl-CoA reductase-like NAD-dependent aldehyde dehydrogenase
MALRETYPLYVANRAEQPNADLEVIDKFSGAVATRVALADAATIDRGIAAAVDAAAPMAAMPAYERQAVLAHCVQRFTERAEELAHALCIEAGKPIRDSRGEVGRLIDTFRIAAEESVRMTGEVQPLDISPRARGYQGLWKRVPIGPCSFVSPFNFPLNLAAHKIAPALAVGCPFVMKPASRTPLGAIIIGEVLAETDLPSGAFSILPAHRSGADLFTTDDRLKLLSFTGSPDVGWDLKVRRSSSWRTPTWTMRWSGPCSGLSTSPASPASGCSASWCMRRSMRRFGPSWWQRRARWWPAIRRTRAPSSGR